MLKTLVKGLRHTAVNLYGSATRTTFRRAPARTACARLLLLVLCGLFGLALDVKAEDAWNSADRSTLTAMYEILQKINQGTTDSGFPVENRNNIEALKNIFSYQSGQNNMYGLTEQSKSYLNMMHFMLGYTATAAGPEGATLASDMASSLEKLEAIKNALGFETSGYNSSLASWLDKFWAIGAGSFFWRVSSDGTFEADSPQSFSEAYELSTWNQSVQGQLLYQIKTAIEGLSGSSGGGIDYTPLLNTINDSILALQHGMTKEEGEDIVTTLLGYDRYITQKKFIEDTLGLPSVDIRRLTYQSLKSPGDVSFFWTFKSQEKATIASLGDFLTVFAANQNEGFIRTTRNLASLGDMIYWAGTNVVSQIAGKQYWGTEEDHGSLGMLTVGTAEDGSQFIVKNPGGHGGSTQIPEENYAPSFTNDLSMVETMVTNQYDQLYAFDAETIKAKYLRNPFGEPTSASVDDVATSGHTVLEIGPLVIDFGQAYELYREKIYVELQAKIKPAFGFAWLFLGILGMSYTVRKTVAGGV